MKYRIAIDLGGTDIKSGVVDEEYHIIKSHTIPTGAKRPFEVVVADMARAAVETAEMAGLEIADFSCVGVGVPSTINPKNGLLVFSNNTNWRNAPLRQELAKHLPVPVYIGNDANCAVIGEALAGAAKGKENVLMLTLGTGVGGGIIYEGKLFVGGDGMGAELGHMTLVHEGIVCTCGLPGCFESYASVSALIQQTRDAMKAHPDSMMNRHMQAHDGRVTGRTAFECAKAGDAAALAVVDQYTTYIANGIGSLCTIFRPEIVLIGGGISNEGDYLLDPINRKLPRYQHASDIIGSPPVVKATLGNSAGTIGAAFLDAM